MQKRMYYWAQGSCPTEDFEIASYELFEAGVQTLEELETAVPEGGVMPDDPIARRITQGLEFGEASPLVSFRFFLEDSAERNRIVTLFPQYAWSVGEEAAKDWDLWWRERQHPVHVSPHLWVRPPWVDFKAPAENHTVLCLEAKSAFGTGEHESTALTATLMEGLDLTDKRILDIGTGTGILSMFALKRGARSALFTEIDPLAIPCLVENFATNACPQALGYLGGLECLRGEDLFDVVVCNMIRSEVWPLRADIIRLLAPGGFFVLSGQLYTEKQYVTDWFLECGLEQVSEIVENEWWSVSARLRR